MMLLFPRAVAVTGLGFHLVNKTSGGDITSGTIDGYVVKDDGDQAALTTAPTHKGNGQWTLNLTAGERDAKITAVHLTHSSGVSLDINIISDDQLGPGSKTAELEFGSAASGADIWITSQADDTVIASGNLDGDGNITLYLDPGSYYAYVQKAGLNFNNPNAFTVT